MWVMQLATLLLVALVPAPIVSVPHDGTSFSKTKTQATITSHDNICVEKGQGDFICTNDPVSTRLLADGHYRQQQTQQLGSQSSPSITNRGVTQRIDGSDAEKLAIQDILARMDDYFLKEVLALPDYASVRSNW
jgi:hypothetical protein